MDKIHNQLIREQLRRLPPNPGVYLMKDLGGAILYVGKAASLRNRVRSYFGSHKGLNPKTEQLVDRIRDIDFFITNSEQEAMILELNLIKQYRPNYNIRLKDDKSFPYLKIDTNDAWPRVYITRQWKKDGGLYFGPFASAWSIRQTLKLIKSIFPTRSCKKPIDGKVQRPCLDYHIKKCLGPCIGAVTKEEYAEVIGQIALFLEGKQEDVIRELKNKMRIEAQLLNFERAAVLRNQIQAVESVIEAQKIATKVRGEQDVIAFVTDRDNAYVQLFIIRNSRLIGRESFTLQGVRAEEPVEIMTSFVKQFYDSSPYVPSLILLKYPVKDKQFIENWLQDKKGSKVHLEVPVRGSKKKLMDTVSENATQALEQMKLKQLVVPRQIDAALNELQKVLNLAKLPERIEGYDISNVQGTSAVGSMVVFEKGRPKLADYRRFKIKTILGSNDYAMLGEVIDRRFKNIKGDDTAREWAVLPDLILIDGGKGQLNAAKEAMGKAGVDVPISSLAKENEEVYVPRRALPIVLSRSSPGLQLLQRVRDEAHRFAVGYHHNIHKKEIFKSVLDDISGIGPKRKRALLKRFGSVRAIQAASVEDIAALSGMNHGLAERIKSSL